MTSPKIRIQKMNRREFIKVTSAAGPGLFLGFCLPNKLVGENLKSRAFEPNAWINVQPDNYVKIMVGKSEMGQGYEAQKSGRYRTRNVSYCRI